MAYTTESKVENMFGIDISGGGSVSLVDIIAAVKAWIDRYTGKTFEATTETRYYDGNGTNSLLIDSFIGTPIVEVLNSDGTTDKLLVEGQNSDFFTGPYNSTEKNQIVFSGLGSYNRFPSYLHRVKVTANFGYSAVVPADIQYVATKLAGELFGDTTEGIIKSISLGDYSATYSDIDQKAGAMGIYSILDLYRDIDV